MQNREAYFEAVGELLNAGQTEAEAHSAVRADHPELFARLAQEAESRRPRVAGGRRQRETPRASAPAPKPTYHALLNSAIAGNPVDPADVVQACKELHRHPNTFWSELRRQRDRIASKLASDTLVNDTAPVAQRRSVSHSRRFDLMVAEAAKCERTYSDNETRAAGFDVANFRSALRDAVHDKVMHRSYAVGSVVCDCSSGVCVCK
jgi:hypothetical protein